MPTNHPSTYEFCNNTILFFTLFHCCEIMTHIFHTITVLFGLNTPAFFNTLPLVKSDFEKVNFQIYKIRLII